MKPTEMQHGFVLTALEAEQYRAAAVWVVENYPAEYYLAENYLVEYYLTEYYLAEYYLAEGVL
jgi:hypothetical protein